MNRMFRAAIAAVLMLVLMTSVLSAEWYLRKRWGLV